MRCDTASWRRAAPQRAYAPGGWDSSYGEAETDYCYDDYQGYANFDCYDGNRRNGRRYIQGESSDPRLEHEQLQIQQNIQTFTTFLVEKTQVKAEKELMKMNAKSEREWTTAAARIERKHAPGVAKRKPEELHCKKDRKRGKEERDFANVASKLERKYDPNVLQWRLRRLAADEDKAKRKIQEKLRNKSIKVQCVDGDDEYAIERELDRLKWEHGTREREVEEKYECDCARLYQKYGPAALEKEMEDLAARKEAKDCKREESFGRRIAKWTNRLTEAPSVLHHKDVQGVHTKMTAKAQKKSVELEALNRARQMKDERRAHRFAWKQRQDFISRQVPTAYAVQDVGPRSHSRQSMAPQAIGIPPFTIQGPGGLQLQVDPTEVCNSVGGFINSFMNQGRC